MKNPMFFGPVIVFALIFALRMLWRAWQILKMIRWTRGARRIWDDFGGECGNDSEYCHWSGDPATTGKCYCQDIAWKHARLARSKTDA